MNRCVFRVMLFAMGCAVAAASVAKPVVIELLVYDARTATTALGNITGTNAKFVARSDTDYLVQNGGGYTLPISRIEVTVAGTPLGTIPGIIDLPGMQVYVSAGSIDFLMPLSTTLPISQGVRAAVTGLAGYGFDRTLPTSDAQSASTYVNLPQSGRISWKPGVADVGLLGAGGVPPIHIPAAELSISILETESIPISSPAMLLLTVILIGVASLAFGRTTKNL